LGIAANTVMFSVLNAVLLRPLPYPHPDKLVQIWETDRRRGETHGAVSPYDFLEWRKNSQSFADIAVYGYKPLVLSGLEAPERINAESVSAGFFDVLEVRAILGRTFRPDEDAPGNAAAVVLSSGAWSRYFERDPNVAGKTITLDDQTYTVVGVMPAGFAFPSESVEACALYPGRSGRLYICRSSQPNRPSGSSSSGSRGRTRGRASRTDLSPQHDDAAG
jgi:putative ABC transport system permease protein